MHAAPGVRCAAERRPPAHDHRSGGERLSLSFGFNQWQLPGGKAPLSRADAVPSVDGSAFFAARVAVPGDAYEVNMVFSDDAGNHDNNQVGGGWVCV